MSINAVLDPFGYQELTPRKLVEIFNIIKVNILLDEFSQFPRHEHLSDRYFFREDDLPEAAIFVSHRWLSSHHPDPDGKQFEALKIFLSFIRRICGSKVGNDALRKVIFTHGGYQAAYFLGAYNRFGPGNDSGAKLPSLGEGVLSKIGVWYDYSSMPQDPATRDQLVSALGRIHELIGASNFVALRQPQDEYDSRAWCAAEVATDPDIGRTHFRKICLRLDLIGQPFDPELLLDQPRHWAKVAERALKELEGVKSGAEAAAAIEDFIEWVGAEAEDNRDWPLFFVKRKPWIFKGQKQFMVSVMGVLRHASAFDEKEASNTSTFSIGLDVAEAVTSCAKSVGLGSSKEGDLPYTALLILYARHRGAPKLAGLFADSLQRYLRGRTTVLARYREQREPYDERCWYRFEDQIGDRPAVAWLD
jgi:hypothetical protein